MTEYDHLLAAALAALCLLLAFGKAPDAPDAKVRRAFFLQGWLTGLGMAGLCLLFWTMADRPLAGFGLESWTGDAPARTAMFALTWTAAVAAILWAIAAGLWRAQLRALYARSAWLMPETRGELGASFGEGLSAGIGEEIAYRGFLLWYLAAFAGLPAAIALSALLFGIAHGYQRLSGCVFAAVAGLLLTFAYLGSGSLLLAIWMHGTWNMASFAAGRIVLGGTRGSDTTATAAA